MKNTFQPPFWKKLRKLPIRPSAVGMTSNFGHRSRSYMSYIFGYGRRTSAFGPTLQLSRDSKKIEIEGGADEFQHQILVHKILVKFPILPYSFEAKLRNTCKVKAFK